MSPPWRQRCTALKVIRSTARPFKFHLTGINKLAYDALINAIAEAGEAPPVTDHIPQNTLVVTEKFWTEMFVRTTPGQYSDPDNARRSLVRAATKLKNMNLIGIWRGYAWPCK